MAVIHTYLTCDLQKLLKVQYLDGNLFSQDNQANEFHVTVTDNGEPAAISGSVTADVIRSDGGTVAVTSGTISGNVASITFPSAVYLVPGVVSIVVKLTTSGVVTTIAAAVANVYQSSTDTVVDPGTIIPSIQTLITSIETAVASIPADYSSLWTSLAPAFSSSASYVAGQYCTYNGAVYRFNTSHTGSWAAGDVTAVNIGGELTALKSAIAVTDDYVFDREFAKMNAIGIGGINSTGAQVTNDKRARTASFYAVKKAFRIDVDSTYTVAVFYWNNSTFVTYTAFNPAGSLFDATGITYTRFRLVFARTDNADMTQTDLTTISNSLSIKEYDTADYTDNVLFAPTWIQGAIRASDGIKGISTNNAIYINAIPKDTIYIDCDPKYRFRAACYGYEGWNDYKGMWTGSAFVKTLTGVDLSSCDIKTLMKNHPEIMYIALSVVNIDGTAVTTSEGSNIRIYSPRTPFIGKKYASLGDSITYGFIPRNYEGYNEHVLQSYANLTAKWLGMTWSNNGISGSSVASGGSNPMVNRYDDLPDDADFVSVMGGTNDARNPNTIPLGTMESRDPATFYGALHTIFAGLYKKYFIDQKRFHTKIFGITPIKLLKTSGGTDGGTGTCWDMEPYAEAFRKVANYYGFPCVDMIHECGINPELNQTVHGTETGYTDWYNPYITDGTHPTQEGAAMMAEVLCGFLKSLQ